MSIPSRTVFTSALFYQDPVAALAWLERAFGFKPAMRITDDQGRLVHAEMSFDEGLIMIGAEWHEDLKSPASLGGKTTQSVHVKMTEGIDAHCERARDAGARIVMEPADQFYGDRAYRAQDLEGHVWSFAQVVETLTPEEWDRRSGLNTKVGS